MEMLLCRMCDADSCALSWKELVKVILDDLSLVFGPLPCLERQNRILPCLFLELRRLSH
jgi:hypothetical protein